MGMTFNAATISQNGVMRPTNVEIHLDRFTENYERIARHVHPAKMMVILKANAYGHGLVPIAHHAVSIGADYLGVAVLEEGILLRESGITAPILVLGGIIGNQVPLFLDNDLTLTASSVEKLAQINEAARARNVRARVHLKIDTGMERIGVHYYSAEPLLESSLSCSHVEVEGIYSHFANSDAENLDSAREQLRRFNQVLAFYDKRGLPPPPMRHMANSGAVLQLPESHFDMVRPGILLYGVYPSDEVKRTVAVKPALWWKSRVVYFKVVKPDHPVSYGSTWQSDKLTRIVTVPIGYGDGYFRSMSGKAEVIIRGKRYPTVGRICMDQLMVNIGWETSYNNDEVVLLGEDETTGAKISCEDLADWAGTIPYEILTNINTRVPRIYLGGNYGPKKSRTGA
jgi:alanine racemase